jgi:Polyketide cyclase / dehydrase and lipid transport
MKTLLIVVTSILVIVFAAVGVAAGVGALLPRRHLASRSAIYRATPEQLFALISGPQSWRPDVLRSDTIAGPDGQALLRETTRDGNTMIYEAFAANPPTSISRRVVGKNLPFTGSWTYSLALSAGGTTVRITEDAEVYNPVFRFMSRFVIGQTRTMDTYLRSLGRATGQEVKIKD